MMRLPLRRFRFTGEHAVADRPSYGSLSKDLFHASLAPEGAHDDVAVSSNNCHYTFL
jgi:hypothetical protein